MHVRREVSVKREEMKVIKSATGVLMSYCFYNYWLKEATYLQQIYTVNSWLLLGPPYTFWGPI